MEYKEIINLAGLRGLGAIMSQLHATCHPMRRRERKQKRIH
jgi:hypothetical protein